MEWLLTMLAAALVGWSLLSSIGGERQARRKAMHARVRLARLERQVANARAA